MAGVPSLLLNRTLSAANQQRDILWTTVATVAITIGLDLILLGPMEQSGLALASTIGVYPNALMLLARMRHHFPALSRCARWRRAPGAGVAAAIGGAVVALLLNLLVPHRRPRLAPDAPRSSPSGGGPRRLRRRSRAALPARSWGTPWDSSAPWSAGAPRTGNLARMPTSLVTGGAGFLGSHLCDRLLAEGHRVICVDNLDTGTSRTSSTSATPAFLSSSTT